MNKDKLISIVTQINYKPEWKFRIHEKGDGFLLQVVFPGVCAVTGKLEEQHCRKWFISSHSTTNEVVGTAWKAVMAAEEHEARENFTYKSVRIFDPHVDMDYLADAMWARKQDVRE